MFDVFDPQQLLVSCWFQATASKALDEQHRLEGDLCAATAAKSRLGKGLWRKYLQIGRNLGANFSWFFLFEEILLTVCLFRDVFCWREFPGRCS